MPPVYGLDQKLQRYALAGATCFCFIISKIPKIHNNFLQILKKELNKCIVKN